MKKITTTLLAGVLLAGTTVGCDDNGFEQAWEISKLRTLAMVADPPEAGPGDVMQLTALSWAPPDGADVALSWEVCFATAGPESYYACATDEDGTPLGFSLGDGPEVSFAYDSLALLVPDSERPAGATDGEVAAAAVEGFCAALQDLNLPELVELPNCNRGYPVTIRMTARTPDGDEEIAYREVLLLNAAEATRDDTNTNPVLGGLLVDGVPADNEGTVHVAADAELALQVLVNTDDAERYEPVLDDGSRGDEIRETLSVSWFTTRGGIERPITYFAEDIVDATELQGNLLKLEAQTAAVPGEIVNLFAVVRDSRGGSSFGAWSISVD